MPDSLLKSYDAYVDTFRMADGRLPELMRLKRVHTAFVVRNAEAIADGEGFSSEERHAAVAAALLHDTGRYEQLRRFNTFRDADSVDHAALSHDIVEEKGWLGSESPAIASAVLAAVLYHNRRDLPEGLDALTEVASHTVRDADKLDIFRVLEDQVEHSDWRSGSRAFWDLPVSAPPTPAVVSCIEGGMPVDYRDIRSLSDFVLIQVGWMLSELRFATSRRLCAERGHLAFRRRFLHQLTDSTAVDRLCDLAERGLSGSR
ncbi:MAG: HD domain-containing protein [Kiritimatiellae bacterium]|nr:HD domain-containing protein [Kiritimatiellia bacterium]